MLVGKLVQTLVVWWVVWMAGRKDNLLVVLMVDLKAELKVDS